MDKVALTTGEKEELKVAIQDAKAYRIERLRVHLVSMVVAMLLLGGARYWNGDLSANTLSAIVFILPIVVLVFGIAWLLAGRSIKKLERDLEIGTKQTGISQIEKINVLNRRITLQDGTTVYEPHPFYGKWAKGDRIYYTTTNSGAHLFDMERME